MKLFRSVSFSLCLFPANYLSKTKENIREIHNESLNIEHSSVGLDKTRETGIPVFPYAVQLDQEGDTVFPSDDNELFLPR